MNPQQGTLTAFCVSFACLVHSSKESRAHKWGIPPLRCHLANPHLLEHPLGRLPQRNQLARHLIRMALV